MPKGSLASSAITPCAKRVKGLIYRPIIGRSDEQRQWPVGSRKGWSLPGAPAKFYPYWTLTRSCHWEFGNNTNGNTFGKDAQYGKINPKVGYPQMFGPVMTNGCDT